MAHLLQDLRYALRQIRNSPGFALTAVLTLAIGIGATTAIFSFVDGVVLQPLAYRDSGELTAVWEKVPFLESMSPYEGPNPRHVLRWRQSQTSFSALALVNEGTTGVALSGDHPSYVGRVRAEPNLLSVLGVQPALGRDFLPGEGVTGSNDRVIISWNLWQQLFHGSPDVLGQVLQVSGAPATVIGVLPRTFYFPKSNELTAFGTAGQSPAVDLLQPNQVNAADYGWNSDYGNFAVIGRLRPGVTPAAAQAQLDSISNAIIHEAPAGEFAPGPKPALSTIVELLKQAVVGRATAGLYLLLAAVSGVLLIACINLANAQLARVLARDKETAVRIALGASVRTLIQTSVMEAAVLACAGAVLGVLVAHAVVTRFATFVHVAIPRAGNIHVNGTVLAVSVASTVTATLLFGLLPALHYLRVRPQAALGGAGRAAGNSSKTIVRRVLIAAQVLACTTLLLLTTLFARNLLKLLQGDNGFSTGGTVQASVRLQGKAFNDPARAAFADAMLNRLRQLPGVTSAAFVSSVLGQGQLWGDEIRPTGASEKQAQIAQFRWISPGYFQTVDQRILAGRGITDADRIPVVDTDATPSPATVPTAAAATVKIAAPIAAVLSDSLAASLWPGQDPLGRTFTRHDHTYRVVGIAAGARTNSLHEAPLSMAFLPYWDNPPYELFFLVHGTGDPALLAPLVRTAIWQQNSSVIIADVRPFDATLADTVAPERLETNLLAGFGVAALLLSLLGIYGTLNYSIGRRTQEFGIRMALGASRSDVYWITFKEVAIPVAAGLLGGWVLSLAAMRVVRSLLQGAPNSSLENVAAVFAILTTATLVASFLPCRRASQLQPMDALRSE